MKLTESTMLTRLSWIFTSAEKRKELWSSSKDEACKDKLDSQEPF
jgi:hypothetical protein